jgi:cell division protein ZapE
LLAGLFEAGVAVVTTTNDAPEELYKHGLQRARFLPAIELIKSQLEFVPLVGPTDYRLRALQKVGVLHTPLNEASSREMLLAFEDIAGSDGETNVIVDVDGRDLLAKRVGDGTAWFTFAELCEKPRGTADYIELAQRYHTVLIEGVPVFHSNMKESMRRFNWLIDEFYDQRVKLVLSAQSGLERIFSDLMTLEGVARTQSRLIEMQTQAYLSQPHLA